MHACIIRREGHTQTHKQSVCVYTVNETIQTAPQTQNTDTDTDKHTPPHRHTNTHQYKDTHRHRTETDQTETH